MGKRIKAVLIAIPFLLVAGYLAGSWYIMSENIVYPIMAITTDAIWIPPSLAKAYLFLSDYDPNAACAISDMPALNSILAGYSSGNSGFGVGNFESQNKAILQLSQQFIDKGADINKPWQGLTLLHAAVFANEPILVQHLLQNNADQNIGLKNPGKPSDNMKPLELAEYLANRKPHNKSSIIIDRSRVIEVFKNFNKRHSQALKPTPIRAAPGSR